MSSFSVPRNSVIIVSVILLFSPTLQSLPINNGFTVKFSPISIKEDINTKSFGAIFSKIPQEPKPQFANEILSKTIIPQVTDLGVGASNQIVRVLFPLGLPNKNNESEKSDNINFINIPIIRQNIKDYKIIVATAPKNIRIGRGEEAKPVVVYIVFSDDDTGDPKSLNIPMVYFVNKPDGNLPFQKNEKVDPLLVIDNNRTVTGLKSTAVLKFVKFRNKLTNQFNDHVPS